MDKLIVGIIVAAAVIYSIRNIINKFNGKGGCDGCSCDAGNKNCNTLK